MSRHHRGGSRWTATTELRVERMILECRALGIEPDARTIAGRFLLALLGALIFLWICGFVAIRAAGLGTWALVILVPALAIIAALIGYELLLFWRRFASRRKDAS